MFTKSDPAKNKRGVDLISDALLFWPSLATCESFLIAGWKMSRHDVINESCTLYGARRFVIECPAPSTTIFLAMKNSIIFISALSLVAMMWLRAIAFQVLLHPTRRQQPAQRVRLTRRPMSEAPKIQSIQSVVDITNRIL